MTAAPFAVFLARYYQAQLALLHVLDPIKASNRRVPENSAASLLHRLHTLFPAEAELWCDPKS